MEPTTYFDQNQLPQRYLSLKPYPIDETRVDVAREGTITLHVELAPNPTYSPGDEGRRAQKGSPESGRRRRGK